MRRKKNFAHHRGGQQAAEARKRKSCWRARKSCTAAAWRLRRRSPKGAELDRLERRLIQKRSLDRKSDNVEKKESQLQERIRKERTNQELQTVMAQQLKELKDCPV